jgi:hypothetical protein
MPASAKTKRNLIAAVVAIAIGSLTNGLASAQGNRPAQGAFPSGNGNVIGRNPNAFGSPTQGAVLACKTCEAIFQYYSSTFTKSTNAIYIGDICGLNKLNARNICRDAAAGKCTRDLLPLLNLPPYDFNGNSLASQFCPAGFIDLTYKSSVNGFGDVKYNTVLCRISVTCIPDCRCEPGFWREGDYCVKIACDNCIPRPDNNTSFISSGYFFWEGQLRYRKRATCTYTYY